MLATIALGNLLIHANQRTGNENMFVNGIAYAVILLPLIAGAFIALLVLGVIRLNRWRYPLGWLLPIIALSLIMVWIERDRNGAFNPQSKGIIAFSMQDTKEIVLNRSSYKFNYIDNIPMLYTGDVIDVRFHHNDHEITFPRVGGLSNSLMSISFLEKSAISQVTFGPQHSPLTLTQALDRARNIETQLTRSGFRPSSNEPRYISLRAISNSKTGIERQTKSWDEANRILKDEEIGIIEMQLFHLTDEHVSSSVKIQNWARGNSSIYDNNFGREWGLVINFSAL